MPGRWGSSASSGWRDSAQRGTRPALRILRRRRRVPGSDRARSENDEAKANLELSLQRGRGIQLTEGAGGPKPSPGGAGQAVRVSAIPAAAIDGTSTCPVLSPLGLLLALAVLVLAARRPSRSSPRAAARVSLAPPADRRSSCPRRRAHHGGTARARGRPARPRGPDDRTFARMRRRTSSSTYRGRCSPRTAPTRRTASRGRRQRRRPRALRPFPSASRRSPIACCRTSSRAPTRRSSARPSSVRSASSGRRPARASSRTRRTSTRSPPAGAALLLRRAKERLLVVLTDGESQPVTNARRMAQLRRDPVIERLRPALGAGRARLHARRPGDAVSADPAARLTLERIASATGGSVYGEGNVGAATRKARRLLGSGPTVVEGQAPDEVRAGALSRRRGAPAARAPALAPRPLAATPCRVSPRGNQGSTASGNPFSSMYENARLAIQGSASGSPPRARHERPRRRPRPAALAGARASQAAERERGAVGGARRARVPADTERLLEQRSGVLGEPMRVLGGDEIAAGLRGFIVCSRKKHSIS